MGGFLFLSSQERIHSKSRGEELAPGHALAYSSIIHLFINHSSPHPSIIHLLIYSSSLFVPLPCFGCHRCWSSPALIFPVTEAAAQQRPSDVTLSVTWLRGCHSQWSLRNQSNSVELAPAWKPLCMVGSGLLAHGSVGGVEGVSGAKQGISVLDMPQSYLKTAFLGLQGGRGYRKLQASRPELSTLGVGGAGGGVQRPWYEGIWG